MTSTPPSNRPVQARRRLRVRRALLAALVTVSVALPVSGAARPAAVPAPAPTPLGALRPADPAALAVRYGTTRADIGAAARAARRHGDLRRAASLRRMAAPGRQFLSFDGRDGGRTAEVFGDLGAARRIAVLVPGADTGLDHYERLRTGARALAATLNRAPGKGSRGDGTPAAVIAWVGYETPATLSPTVLTPGRAEQAAPALRAFVSGLGAADPGARISLLCHSYGAVVCGRAVHGLPVGDLVLYGSPGAGTDTAAGLRTGARVWAGRGAADWVGHLPHARLRLPFTDTTLGLGRDPLSPAFGARRFDAGPGGHSDYLRPGSTALRNIARIVAGARGGLTGGRA